MNTHWNQNICIPNRIPKLKSDKDLLLFIGELQEAMKWEKLLRAVDNLNGLTK